MDLQTVLNAVAESAARVCGANDAHIYRIDGDVLRFTAYYGTIGTTALARESGVPAVRETVTGRSVVDRRTVHVHDLAAELDEFPASRSALPQSVAAAEKLRVKLQILEVSTPGE